MQITKISSNYNQQNKITFHGSTIIKQSLESLPAKVVETLYSIENKIVDSSDYHTLCITSDVKAEQKILHLLNINQIKNTHLKFNILEGKNDEEMEKFFIELRTPEKPKSPDKFI